MEIKEVAIKIGVLSDESLGQAIGDTNKTPGLGIYRAASNTGKNYEQ